MSFKKILFILEKENRNKAIILIVISLPVAFLELLGIGMIIPLISVLINEDSQYRSLLEFFKINPNNQNILFIIIFAINIVYFCKFLLSSFLIYLRNKFNHNLFLKLSTNIFKNYLQENYFFHLKNNSSKLIRNTKDEVALFCFNVINPIIEIIIELIIFLSICIFLLLYNFKVTIFVILFFSVISFAWYRYFHKRFYEYGKIRHKHTSGMLQQMQEAFAGIKEIIIYKLENIFYDRFFYHTKKNANAGIKKDTLINFPRLIYEFSMIFILSSVIVIFVVRGLKFEEILLLMSVFIFSSIRLLPSFTKIIRGMQQIRYNHVVIDVLEKYLQSKNISTTKENFHKKIKYDFESINFNSVTYLYPDTDKIILKSINLKILKNQKIAIIGETGSGKSTLINLFCGMIPPTSGSIMVNGDLNINEDPYNWIKNISYVPQNSKILDESILFNITFKNSLNKLEHQKLDDIIKIVKLKEFTERLPKGLDTFAGENGINFSGGQSQRIGIARALFKDTPILLMDEATNSLDINTEIEIMTAIQKLSKTILHITHKKSIADMNDKIFEVKNKKLTQLR